MSLENLDSLTAVEVAKLLGVTDRAVRKWITSKDLPCNPGDGVKTFRWPDVLAWHDATVRNEGGTVGTAVKIQPVPDDPGDSETYEEALARKTRADANLQELKLAKARGEVVTIADVERVLAAGNKSLQTQILAMPTNLADRIVGMEDVAQIRSVIELEVHQALTNMATIDAVRDSSSLELEAE